MPLTNPTHAWNQSSFHTQADSIRNSFDNGNLARNANNYNGFHNWNNWNHAGWSQDWWGYPGGWYAPGWAAATAWSEVGYGALADFEGLVSDQPVYGDYGNSIVYQGDNVYYNGQPYGSADQYYQQAEQLAAAGLPASDASFEISPAPTDKWKPLGVFSLVQGAQTQSTMLMQLAINQEGVVKGNYYNELTGESSVITGSLNRSTQRVAWTMGANKSTVFDTTLGNLCKAESPILVHYGSQDTQQLALIRMDPPKGAPPATAPATSASPASMSPVVTASAAAK